MKKINKYLGVLSVLLGIILSRFMVAKYGENSRIALITICLILLSIIIGWLIINKKYLDSIITTAISIPILIGGIGLYLDNLRLSELGIALLIITIPIMIKVKKYLIKKGVR